MQYVALANFAVSSTVDETEDNHPYLTVTLNDGRSLVVEPQEAVGVFMLVIPGTGRGDLADWSDYPDLDEAEATRLLLRQIARS